MRKSFAMAGYRSINRRHVVPTQCAKWVAELRALAASPVGHSGQFAEIAL